ncbi:protein phosphatase 1 regulatory subunit 12B-like isoform X2 [Corythoichthys intestinalis]|uniref:protein phosphatase 1 regulatory subunit 12B-like isoform X2 n=1 Tax=Corythoichthys intestinalis TaxID=161448 RepID=UPI0025A568F6|nr:protein phosphatase 1 regulatory subunit 12B-like isoform X2 [Corythoichthys intestinalis]
MSSQMSLIKDHPRITKSTSDSSSSSSSSASESLRHERVSRLNSHGVSDASNEATKNHAESYFSRRENRLSARKKAEEEIARNDYKKMYEKALATNQRLKSRLETSKQELVVIQEQLQRAQQKERKSELGCNMLETEKKAKVELHTENQRLKDENGALIRVITKLSK